MGSLPQELYFYAFGYFQVIVVDVLSGVVMKNSAFWDMVLCIPLKISQLYGGIHCCHLQSEE
jgi:hypothetical protein